MSTAGWRILASIVLVMLVTGLFYFGAQPYAATLVPGPWDKLAHLVYSAGVALFAWLALGGRGALWALVATVSLGAVDEWRQTSLPGREPEMLDLVAGVAGAVLMVCVVVGAGRRRTPHATEGGRHEE